MADRQEPQPASAGLHAGLKLGLEAAVAIAPVPCHFA